MHVAPEESKSGEEPASLVLAAAVSAAAVAQRAKHGSKQTRIIPLKLISDTAFAWRF